MPTTLPRLADCDTCGGSGVTWSDVADYRGEHDTEERPCEACDGTRQVEASDETEAA